MSLKSSAPNKRDSKRACLQNLTYTLFYKKLRSDLELPGGGLGIFTDRDQRSILLGFEFRKSVIFLALLTAAVFFGLLDKCCIFNGMSREPYGALRSVIARFFFCIFHALSFELNFFRPEVPFNSIFWSSFMHLVHQQSRFSIIIISCLTFAK